MYDLDVTSGGIARLIAMAYGATACSVLVSLDDLHQPDASAESGDAPTSDAVNDVVTDAPSDTQSHVIAFVQQTAGFYESTGLLFASPVAEGNAVIVVVANSKPGAVTVNDVNSNTYVSILGTYAASYGGTLQLFSALGVKGGFTTLDVSAPDGGTGYSYYAAEYAGITTFDKSATGNSQSMGTDGLASSSVTTTASPELLFAYAEGIQSVSAGTSFTPRSLFDSNVMEERIATTLGSYQATATLSGGTGDIILASFH
jgi:hypothetical protein